MEQKTDRQTIEKENNLIRDLIDLEKWGQPPFMLGYTHATDQYTLSVFCFLMSQNTSQGLRFPRKSAFALLLVIQMGQCWNQIVFKMKEWSKFVRMTEV